MKVFFSYHADGAQWSQTPSLETVTLGQFGLADLLCTRLGCQRPSNSMGVRIAALRQAIDHVLNTLPQSTAAQWCADSFRVAPWAAASSILRLRDLLVEAGWDATEWLADKQKSGADELQRLTAVAEIEVAAKTLADKRVPQAGTDTVVSLYGYPDQLQTIVGLLQDISQSGMPWPLGIESIHVLHDRHLLPPTWLKILDLLSELGVTVSDGGTTASGTQNGCDTTGSDSGLHGGSSSAASKLLVVNTANEWDAAQATAAVIDSIASEHQPYLVLAGQSTKTLDYYLARRGLPQVGVGNSDSPAAIQQLITTFLAACVSPRHILDVVSLCNLPIADGRVLTAAPSGQLERVDAETAVGEQHLDETEIFDSAITASSSAAGDSNTAEADELWRKYYTDSIYLFPPKLRILITRTLANTPGFGGAAWNEALTLARTHYAQSPRADEYHELIDTFDRFFNTELVKPVDQAADPAAYTYPANDLIDRLSWLRKRVQRFVFANSQLFALLTAVDDLIAVLNSVGGDVSLSELNQIIGTLSSTLGRGGVAAQATEDGGYATDPATAASNTGTVIWWLAQSPPTSTPAVLRSVERKVLEERGLFATDGEFLQRLTHAARLAALQRASRIIAVTSDIYDLPHTSPDPLLTFLALANTPHPQHGDDILKPFTVHYSDLCAERNTVDTTPGQQDDPSSNLPAHNTKRWEALIDTTNWRKPEAQVFSSNVDAEQMSITPRGFVPNTKLSHSQMETIAKNPLEWLITKQLNVSRGSLRNLAHENTFIGTALHAIAEKLVVDQLYQPGEVVDKQTIERVFDTVIAEQLADYTHPDKTLSRNALRTAAVESLHSFFHDLAEMNMVITDVEEDFTMTLSDNDADYPHLQGLTLGGRIDVTIRTADGRPGVIDLKYSGSKTKIPNRVKAGALQTAIYKYALAEKHDTHNETIGTQDTGTTSKSATLDPVDIPSAFFGLKQNEWWSSSQEFPDTLTVEKTDREIIEAARNLVDYVATCFGHGVAPIAITGETSHNGRPVFSLSEKDNKPEYQATRQLLRLEGDFS
ncbi:PD-(D/E)XK nuclease family protein [Corynebacterium choanae]|uniref:PD-(D/E)XK nuclease superfamily protein n=1 Tax=Corynebacterium choanae TaxID=1862358 RepID=A0A3G6J4M3_9CORY|nr:PD-(D/E)XK nuclease family protein [Corynebacterium choanae]AZA12977.1 PD-(D/E)XK nuclease superfamily protein [Corynebacterium choanae]